MLKYRKLSLPAAVGGRASKGALLHRSSIERGASAEVLYSLRFLRGLYDRSDSLVTYSEVDRQRAQAPGCGEGANR